MDEVDECLDEVSCERLSVQ